MSTLILSPLTDTEVYARNGKADSLVAMSARAGEHDPGHFWHKLFVKFVAESQVLHDAMRQRCGAGVAA